jgi:hypothetical protein
MNLDLNRAILLHRSWRLRVREYLEESEKTDPAFAVSSRECELGKWLYRTGIEKYGHLPEMKILESVHARMHRAAGQLIHFKEGGQYIEARQHYAKMAELSEEVAALLKQLERTHREPSAPPAEPSPKPWPSSR